jgi:gamma-glutamyltranspeptidase/glutathione hydrolase
MVEFGMSLQEALDAPTVHSHHVPASFYPREATPAGVAVENRVPSDVIRELERRGHKVTVDEGWVHGSVMGILYDAERGVIRGGASAKRNTGYAIGM